MKYSEIPMNSYFSYTHTNANGYSVTLISYKSRKGIEEIWVNDGTDLQDYRYSRVKKYISNFKPLGSKIPDPAEVFPEYLI